MLSEKSEINRVIRLGKRSDRFMSRASLSGLLDTTVLRPAGLRHDTVLISKTIRCALKPSAGLGRQVDLSNWQAEVHKALEASRRRATRYLKGVCLVSGADSVVFDSVPEALACFICDIARGNVHCEWWWASYLRKYPVGSDRFAAIAEIMEDNLVLLPQIVRYLAEWKMLPAVFGGVSDFKCAEMIGNFKACFRLSVVPNGERMDELLRLLSGFSDASDPTEKIESDFRRLIEEPESLEGSNSSSNQQAAINSNAGKAIRSIESLGYQTASSGSGVNQPDIVEWLDLMFYATRHTSFKNFFYGLWQEFIGDSVALTELSVAQGNLAGLVYLTGHNLQIVRGKKFQRAFSVLSHPIVKSNFYEIQYALRARVTPDFFEANDLAGYTNLKAHRLSFIPPANESAPLLGEIELIDKKSALLETVASLTQDNEPTVSGLSGQFSSLPVFSSPFDLSREWQWTTDYGGVFYLFNLLRFLDIPDVFADAGEIHNMLSPWAWLEILARFLLVNESHVDDDLWKALALLDNREANLMLGSDERLNGELLVPQPWLDYLGCSDIHLSDRAEIEVSCALDGMVTGSLLRLLEILLPVIKRCLICATGEKSELIIADILRCRGHISITRTHVDFYTSLDNISLAARRAGLDRDPGWCPEVGKVVQFHFE